MPVQLRTGQAFTITTAKILGDSTRVNTTFLPLPREVHAGDRILLSDGLIELRVENVRGREVNCRVVNGGALGEHKGINLPGVQLHVPALTAKDREDLRFALAHGVDYIAVSFVRRPEDVLLAKRLVRRARKDTPVIAKLEKPEAIENLEEILRVSGRRDGGARRLGRGDEPGARARGAESDHRQSAGVSPAGDYRNADAGIDDRESTPDARRGFRRGQRDF
jgi:pyruvate kinase